MNIKEFNYNVVSGFAWILVYHETKLLPLTVHCCLESNASGNYITQISESDNECDKGICGDVNEEAFNLFGKENCINALLDEAEKQGITVV